jgi:hypothetical protein
MGGFKVLTPEKAVFFGCIIYPQVVQYLWPRKLLLGTNVSLHPMLNPEKIMVQLCDQYLEYDEIQTQAGNGKYTYSE